MSALLAGGVAIEWHDAVAIVQQLADEIAPDVARPPAGSVPDPESIVLEPNGRLHTCIDRSANEPLVAGLARLLQKLLRDNRVPTNLRLLAQATADTVPPPSLQHWISELARWERPGRLGKLVSLYERSRNLPPAPRRTATPALVRNAAIVREPSGETVRNEPQSNHPKPLRGPKPIVLVAFAMLGCILGGGIMTLLLMQPSPSAPTPPPAIERDIELPLAPEDAVATESSVSGTAAATPQAPRLPSGRTIARTDPQVLRVPHPPEPVGAAAVAAAPQERVSPVLPPLAAVPDPASRSSGSRSTTAEVARTTPLFQAGDEGVREPVLLNQYLRPRSREDSRDSAAGVLEVLVDTRGLVESVRLNSPANRYRDKWWLFTAKGWRFEPAMKDGKPVRFLKRIPLADLTPSGPQ